MVCNLQSNIEIAVPQLCGKSITVTVKTSQWTRDALKTTSNLGDTHNSKHNQIICYRKKTTNWFSQKGSSSSIRDKEASEPCMFHAIIPHLCTPLDLGAAASTSVAVTDWSPSVL